MKKIHLILYVLLYIFIPFLFGEDKPKQWSEYQGEFSWETAFNKCENLGMRLPTIQEFKIAFNAKLTKTWAEKGESYWTIHEAHRTFDDAYGFNIVFGEHGLSYKNVYKHVRCIR